MADKENVVVSTSEDKLLQDAEPKYGVDYDFMSNKPVLLFKGTKNDILADGFMLLYGHGASEFLNDYLQSNKASTDIKKGLFLKNKDEAKSFIQEQLKKPTGTYPDVKSLTPRPKDWSGELTIVGASDSTENMHKGDKPYRILYLTDGDRIIAVNANKYAFLRDKLPTAKIYGQRERSLEYPHQTEESLGKSEWVPLDRVNPSSPISFVIGGKAVGVLVPLKVDDVPEPIMKKASTLPITTKPSGHVIKARRSGTLTDGQETDLVLYLSKMQQMSEDVVYSGPESRYKGEGERYIRLDFKGHPTQVMAFQSKKPDKWGAVTVPRPRDYTATRAERDRVSFKKEKHFTSSPI